MLKTLIACTLLGCATADIVFSRTINKATIGSGTATIEGPACTGKDAYGSNDCDVHWATNYTLDLDLTLSQDIVAGHKIDVDLKLDGLIPFKLNCALCGADCTFTIPIIKKKVTVKAPACPIKAAAVKKSIVLPVPAALPLPKTSAKGKVTVTDPSGATVADVDVKATVSSSLEGVRNRKYMVDLDANGHYGDPKAGCANDEISVRITGIKGDVCTPPCSGTSCPTDVPAGVTATPLCALKDPSGKQYCILECTPSVESPNGKDGQCGTATCKPIQGVGICTYDD